MKDWTKELETYSNAPWVKRQRLSEDDLKRKLLDRVGSYIGSFSLRRGFNQSFDEYLAANPDYDNSVAFTEKLQPELESESECDPERVIDLSAAWPQLS